MSEFKKWNETVDKSIREINDVILSLKEKYHEADNKKNEELKKQIMKEIERCQRDKDDFLEQRKQIIQQQEMYKHEQKTKNPYGYGGLRAVGGYDFLNKLARYVLKIIPHTKFIGELISGKQMPPGFVARGKKKEQYFRFL